MSIDPDLIRLLDEAAREKHYTRSVAVREMLRLGIDEHRRRERLLAVMQRAAV